MHHGKNVKTDPDALGRARQGKSINVVTSPGVRGRETHGLTIAGRKTGRRTQGGKTKGAGRGFKF